MRLSVSRTPAKGAITWDASKSEVRRDIKCHPMMCKQAELTLGDAKTFLFHSTNRNTLNPRNATTSYDEARTTYYSSAFWPISPE
ncbi:hypothetical protein GDO78_015871 [Eleutherodactylus coqui]|uniref:Uncharacterized protein n=1 Tax=Eleutherodactylus coqui TaxID=57060 RepID=A0A8J6BKD2_ELECQ|nr:hypothetical protein GDO78_015871 [Eleutherodactylus coqui]